MTDVLETYREAWRQRLEQQERVRAGRFQKAGVCADSCARLLYENFDVSAVYLVGSVMRPDCFHSRSDIDLAVEGLDDSEYMSALTECWRLLPLGFKLDLIDLQDLSSRNRASLVSSGRRLAR